MNVKNVRELLVELMVLVRSILTKELSLSERDANPRNHNVHQNSMKFVALNSNLRGSNS
jgi:hypothetical protein